MFTLFQSLATQEVLKRELMPFASAFLLADLFYKFHSFALECLAFLATWYALSFLQGLLFGLRRR